MKSFLKMQSSGWHKEDKIELNEKGDSDLQLEFPFYGRFLLMFWLLSREVFCKTLPIFFTDLDKTGFKYYNFHMCFFLEENFYAF